MMFGKLFSGWRDLLETVTSAEKHLGRIAGLAKKQQALLELQQAQISRMEMYIGRIEHHLVLSHPRFASPLRLERYGRRRFSQTDEDGIIAEIFRRIGPRSHVFVEIAAGDGRENCTANLLAQGWRGLWVECAEKNVASIRKQWAKELEQGRLKLSSEFLEVAKLNETIEGADLGAEIDLFVMDIDGNDYYMLEALKARPRVICAEYNSRKPPPQHWVMPYQEKFIPWGGRDVGASLQALHDLLTPRGYRLVGSSIAGINCFFVREDLVGDRFQAPFTPENHYNSARYFLPTLSFDAPIWLGLEEGAPPTAKPDSDAGA